MLFIRVLCTRREKLWRTSPPQFSTISSSVRRRRKEARLKEVLEARPVEHQPFTLLHVALLGPPGSGKGTQARRLVDRFGLAYVGAGDLLRQEVAQDSPHASDIKAFLDAGQLVPLPLLMEVIEHFVAQIPPHQGIVFDGIPRSLDQALALDELLQRVGRQLDVVILLSVPDEVVYERLLQRGRSDDTPEVIARRLEIYHREIRPLEAFYRRRSILRVVDGVGTPDEVFERIEQVLDSLEKPSE